jgi:hypothetical protein
MMSVEVCESDDSAASCAASAASRARSLGFGARLDRRMRKNQAFCCLGHVGLSLGACNNLGVIKKPCTL